MAPTTATAGTNSSSELAEKLSGLYNQSQLADVKIAVGNASISAYRLVLCLHSSCFEDALTGAFSEASSATLTCEPDKKHAYLRMLQYLYSGDYAEEPSALISEDDDPELQKHPRVYFLAESLFLADLKDLALSKFVAALARLWVSEGLVECIMEIYDNTPAGTDGMRAAVIQSVVEHREELLSKPAFKGLLSDGGDFAVETDQALVGKQADLS